MIMKTVQWVIDDFRSYPFRFIAELLAWIFSISCSIILAITIPTPPLHILYPLWIVSSTIYSWTAFTRNSFGMLINYLLLMTIDIIGITRLMIH
jgi:hypothetical protein